MKHFNRLVFVLSALTSCNKPSTILSESKSQIILRLKNPIQASLLDDTICYLGFEAFPQGAFGGDEITVIHYWIAKKPIDKKYRIFVHSLVQGASGWIPHSDHNPIPSINLWPVDKVIRDEHRITLPEKIPGTTIELRVGLYQPNTKDRAVVDDAKKHDGTNRILAGSISVTGTEIPLPIYYAPRLTKPPKLDGIIGNLEWGNAPWIDKFILSRAESPSRVQTRARMAWDENHLYLAFYALDPDIIASYKNRDDPIYQEESLEIFIDPNGDKSSYVELQINPLGTQFDASFIGGARRNMNKSYNARYRVGTKIEGTISSSKLGRLPEDKDKSWVNEWAIEVNSLPGIQQKLNKDIKWSINLFRIAKDRTTAGIVRDESAWSPPLMGDFHNLQRFGEVRFVE